MGRQWLHAKRLAAGLKKGRTTGKLVREISIAAKVGGADPDMNPRLAAAIDRAKKSSVTRDAIERAIKKGAGIGDDKMAVEYSVYEGYAPHKVPVIVEVYTDNPNRTAPEIRVLFKKGQLGNTGSNKFLFEHVGLVEAYHANPHIDREAAAIESGCDDFQTLTIEQNDEVPENSSGAKFICDKSEVHQVSKSLSTGGWTILTAEIGYIPKQIATLTDEQKMEVGDFLQALEDHDDVHRVWAAID